MRILTVINRANQVQGDAAITTMTLLKKLHRNFGYECVICTPHLLQQYEKNQGIESITYRDLEELKSIVRMKEPSVIMGINEGTTAACRVAVYFDVPFMAYFQSYDYCEPTVSEKEQWGLSLTRAYPSPEEVKFVFEKSDKFLTNSQYMKTVLEQRHERHVEVLYPEFAVEDILIDTRSREKNEFISGMCGYRHTGAEVFLRLAEAFPHQRFLLIGDVDPAIQRKFRHQTNITLLGRTPVKEFLAKSKIVLVPSQWPEPFGRIAVEAMATGIPVLVSQTGGLEEIVQDSCMGVTEFRDTTVWLDQLHRLLHSEDRYASFVTHSRTLASRFLMGDSTKQLSQILNSLRSLRVPQYHNRKIIKFYGDNQKKTAYSLVNASWMHELQKIDSGPACVDNTQSTSLELPDYVLHHNFEQKFLDFVPPESGKCIAVRTWDFGHYPPAWVERINSTFDQLWVYSHWTKSQAITSGIDPDRVRVVPLGFHNSTFHPQGEGFPLNTKKGFKFLFVGGTVYRKGIDILLKAYAQTFTADDDVCLVIKDHSGDVFYSNISFKAKILELMRDKHSPEIMYIDDFLTLEQLAALYRTCNVGVFPYRSEGFGIPILEAMGSGTPSIAPNFGPCLDFCSDETSFLMPVKRIHLPVHRQFLMNTLGFEEDVPEVDFGETKVETLMKAMKQAYLTSEIDLNRLGSNGVQIAHNHFTWKNSITMFMQHLQELDQVKTPWRVEIKRFQNEKAYKIFEIASQLYSEVRCETVNISSTA